MTANSATPSINDRLASPISQWTLALRQHSREMRVAVPGIIHSFNAATQTAVVQVAISEPMNAYSMENGGLTVTQKEVSIPLLPDVPVLLPKCAGFALTLPLTQGDEGLLIFADCKIDYFWQNGKIASTNGDPRRHDLSDAMFIPCGVSQPNVLSDYSTDSAQLRSTDGSTVVDVADGTVTVKATHVVADNGGTAQALVTNAWLTWFASDIYPFLVSKGYTGPAAPANSATTVLSAQ